MSVAHVYVGGNLLTLSEKFSDKMELLYAHYTTFRRKLLYRILLPSVLVSYLSFTFMGLCIVNHCQ